VTEQPEIHGVYVISVFAQLAGVHPQTLRNYERGGLLNPERTRGGSRRFSDADLAALRRIQELTSEGVNLVGVKRIMVLEGEIAEVKEAMNSLSDEARANVERTHRHYRRDLVPVQNTLALIIEKVRRPRADR
jgi:MerR family transcriptional regulator/heat shock protein HspR